MAPLRARVVIGRIGYPVVTPDGLIRQHGSAHLMKHRMTRTWQLAMAVAPLAAIAVVEAAMKRWF